MAIAPASLLDRRLLFVTGKGGVGKSTVATAIAWLAASEGKRVLLCEFDAKGDLLRSLSDPGSTRSAPPQPLTFEPREVQPRLFAMVMDPEASLKEYLKINLRIPFITKIGALSTAFDFVANAAPGVREIVTVGKVAYEVREKHYDLVVVDATATGHIVGQLRAPQAINELVGVGAIRSQTSWILDILQDPAQTGVVVTTTPEEMPVVETIDLLEKVRIETSVDIAAVVVNRLLPELFSASSEKLFAKLCTEGGRSRLGAALGDRAAVDHMLSGAKLVTDLRRQRAEHFNRLVEHVTATSAGRPLPLVLVPQLFGVPSGLGTTRQVAAYISDEIG